MKRKKLTRTYEVTLQTSEVITVRRPLAQRAIWCTVCGHIEMFAHMAEVIRSGTLRQREIFRCIESGDIGFAELSSGAFLICLRCASNFGEVENNNEI
jgi:hypothetical protein